uniref:Uncharacterized protein n=1 Tax=Skeletonema virus LDF-2015a TaxID=1769778 RepID=A0A1B1IHW3_9VIRU|nr:hypothetical protein AUR56_00020 [Skeletonema virus LDF-2015a]
MCHACGHVPARAAGKLLVERRTADDFLAIADKANGLRVHIDAGGVVGVAVRRRAAGHLDIVAAFDLGRIAVNGHIALIFRRTNRQRGREFHDPASRAVFPTGFGRAGLRVLALFVAVVHLPRKRLRGQSLLDLLHHVRDMAVAGHCGLLQRAKQFVHARSVLFDRQRKPVVLFVVGDRAVIGVGGLLRPRIAADDTTDRGREVFAG